MTTMGLGITASNGLASNSLVINSPASNSLARIVRQQVTANWSGSRLRQVTENRSQMSRVEIRIVCGVRQLQVKIRKNSNELNKLLRC